MWDHLARTGRVEIEERVPTLAFKSFGAFMEGAAERAERVGATGASSPQHWIGGFVGGDDHVLVTLHAISPDAMAGYSDRLSAMWPRAMPFERSGGRTGWR